MTHHANPPISGDNDHAVPPSGAAHLVGPHDDDTTDDEFMELVAQVNAESGDHEDAQQAKPGESK